MNRAKELLEQATPLRWATEHGYLYHQMDNIGKVWGTNRVSRADAALIVYAVNRLPDYEAVVEALDRLVTSVEMFAGEFEQDVSMAEARAALARLRDKVPA